MAAPRALRFGAYRLDLVNQCLLRDGDVVPLAPKPFALLCYLVANPGRLVTKDELLDAVWPDTYVGDAVLKVAVGKVRRALGDEGSEGGAVATVSRKGYRFVLDVAPDDAARATPASAPPSAAEAASLPSLTPLRARAVPLVGRDGDLVALDACRERALGGDRQVVFVTGEAGIGKSTIIDSWIASRLDARARVGRGQCLDHFGGSEAYLPVLEALGSLARGDDGRRVVEALRRVAPSWLAQMPWLVDEEARATLQQELAGATRERMLREIAELIEELGRDRLLVLVLEDLHWSDPSTLDVLSFAAQRRGPARLLLIGSYRPVDAVVAEHAIRDVKHRLQARQLCHEIPLGYLAEEDIERYAALRLGGPPPRALAPLLHQRTSCSPLFVTSVVDHLLARRLLVEADGAWRLVAPADEIAREVPEGLRGMIERQVEALDPAEASVLEAGAVAGVEFSAALAAAATGLELDVVEERCERLAPQARLIRHAGVAQVDDGLPSGRYAFVHALHRNVVYQRTPPARRQRLHKRLGAWLEAHDASPGQLAHHFLVAGQPADLAKAVVYAQRAAERARAVFAYDEAARHHGTALRAAEARGGLSDAERCILLLEHAEALEHAAAIDRAEESFRRAVEIARRLDDADLFARAVLSFGSRYGRLRADPAMVAALEEALARVGDQAAPPVRARLLSRLEFCLSAEPGPAVLARRAEVRADLRRVQRTLDDPATEIWVARCTRWAFAGPQTQREIEAGLARLDALLPRLQQPEDRMSVRLLRVLDLLELGRTDEVDDELAVLDAEVARTPIGWFAWFVLRYKALLALLRGELEAAARLMKEAVAVGESTEHPHIRPTYLLQRFALRRLRGDDPAEDVALFAAANSAQLAVTNVAQWQPMLVYAHALAGQRVEAAAGLAELGRDDFRAIPENTLFSVWMAYLAMTCAIVADQQHAAVLLRLLEPYADRMWGVGAGTLVLGHGGRYVGLLHATLGNVPAATRHFERAIAENERARAVPWLAATQVDLARLLLAPTQRGRDARTRGLALAEAARASAARLGMQQLALDAAALTQA